MKRAALALLFGAIAAAVLWWPHRGPAPAPPAPAVIVTNGPATPLDAALILRAILRFSPHSIEFLDPLAGEEGRPLLTSKLADTKVPVTFTTTPAARAAAPSQAGERISMDRLMLRTERSERGEIATDLDTFFHGREVVVAAAGDSVPGAAGPAPVPAPAWFGWLGVLLAASLPWWRLGRLDRVLAAICVASFGLLLAIAIAQQFDVTVPFRVALLLPVLAVIPRGSRKSAGQKPPSEPGPPA